MLKQIIGKNIVEHDLAWWQEYKSHFKSVVIDIGAGDGQFALKLAQERSDTLVVALDADYWNFSKLSNKAHRNHRTNLIYLWHAAEQIPEELHGSFDEIIINFPWASLLGGLWRPGIILENISQLAKPGASLQILATYSHAYEAQMIAEYQLPELTANLTSQLSTLYAQYGWTNLDWQIKSLEEIDLTSWGKRITSQRERTVWELCATKSIN
jgi:2-polyprenyl-3-methyl-5-hydroxy-6-metoxy-1,4-benzoquinol methylase